MSIMHFRFHWRRDSNNTWALRGQVMLDYVTYKYVRLRDSRLGALYYILAFLILIYSAIEIFLRKGYLEVYIAGNGFTLSLLSLLLFSSVHPSVSLVISVNIQLDTNPQGTVKLILSDDFAEESSSPVSDNLPYCGGNITCRYLDPWDLNWPIGTWVHIMKYNRCTYSLVNHPYFLGGGPTYHVRMCVMKEK